MFSIVSVDIEGFYIEEEMNLLSGTPTDRASQPGIYQIGIQSVVDTGDEQFSFMSEMIEIEIIDPCPYTEIISSPVPDLYSDIGFFAQTNLRNHNWPWLDVVDTASNQFGVDKCGLKKYYITDDQMNEVPYVELRADGTLIMSPIDGRDQVGSKTCLLHAYMEEFNLIATAEPFRCDIPKCTPVIKPNGARGPTKLTTYWQEQTATFNIATEMAKYTVGPMCGYDLKFAAIIKDKDGVVGNYAEVQCDDLTTCYISKCNGSMIGDTECNAIPYDMYFTVIIQAYLDDGTYDEAITFPVEILDPCKSDKISFAPGVDSFTYYLTTPESIVTRTPTVVQSFGNLCPHVCAVRDSAQGQNSIPSIMSLLDNQSGQVQVEVADKQLAGKTFYYELRCISMISTIPQRQASNFFEVKFYDECKDA